MQHLPVPHATLAYHHTLVQCRASFRMSLSEVYNVVDICKLKRDAACVYSGFLTMLTLWRVLQVEMFTALHHGARSRPEYLDITNLQHNSKKG